MIKDKKTLKIVSEVMIIFVWMIVALAWDSAINTIIETIRESFPFAWIMASIMYAVLVTVIAIFIIVVVMKKLDWTWSEWEKKE